ncbi:hypothetical protein ACQ9QD_05170 [Bacillus paralicheniformis]
MSFLKPNANAKSLSVETCVEKVGKIHGETVQNAAELIADLCKCYDLSTEFRKKSILCSNCIKDNIITSQSSKSTGTILKKGSSGSQVKTLQKRLIAAGFSPPEYRADLVLRR